MTITTETIREKTASTPLTGSTRQQTLRSALSTQRRTDSSICDDARMRNMSTSRRGNRTYQLDYFPEQCRTGSSTNDHSNESTIDNDRSLLLDQTLITQSDDRLVQYLLKYVSKGNTIHGNFLNE